MKEAAGSDLKVGVFVSLLLLLMTGTVFLLSGSSDILEDRYTLNAAWSDVAGLKEGAVVRLAGWDVGEVVSIQFSDDLGVREIFVEMKVMQRYQPRIRKDSVARIDTQGVLGDKYVAITMGSTEEPILENTWWIETRQPLNVLTYTRKATEILENAESISRKVDLMMGNDEDVAQARVAASAGHIEELLRETTEGSGLLHTLIYDKELTDRANVALGNFEAVSVSMRDVIDEVRGGDGLAHEIVYGEEGASLARRLNTLAHELEGLSRDLKQEGSLAHALIYDPDKV
ncbi:MAG: MlaD family protein, partial [Myxococcota bacterium]|nr:MlaD family protein [Myxococcota bacterium]